MIAQEDDEELFEWIMNAHTDGGGFVRAMARAALTADAQNYDIIRPALLQIREKYPKYNGPRREQAS